MDCCRGGCVSVFLVVVVTVPGDGGGTGGRGHLTEPSLVPQSGLYLVGTHSRGVHPPVLTGVVIAVPDDVRWDALTGAGGQCK